MGDRGLFLQPHDPCCRDIALKRHRAHRPNPTADFAGIGLVHVKEVGHHRPYDSLAAVVRRHGDNASEDLDRPAVPIFGHLVKGGETRVDEGPEVLTDHFASVPFRDAKTARGILHKAVKTFAKGLIVDFLPKSQQPFRRLRLREGQYGGFLILSFFVLHSSIPF